MDDLELSMVISARITHKRGALGAQCLFPATTRIVKVDNTINSVFPLFVVVVVAFEKRLAAKFYTAQPAC